MSHGAVQQQASAIYARRHIGLLAACQQVVIDK